VTTTPPESSAAAPSGDAGAALNSRLTRGLVIGTVAGVLIYAAFLAWADLDAVGAALKQFDLALLAPVLAVVMLGYAVRFLRWERYRTLLGIELHRATSLRIFLSGFALTVTPGKLGEAFKSVLVKEETGLPVAHTAPVVIAERLTDLLGLLVLVAIAGMKTSQHAWIYGLAFLAVVVLFVIVGSPGLSWKALSLLARLPGGSKITPGLEKMLSSTRALLTPRELPLAIGLATFAWALECLAFHWILGGFGVSAPDFLMSVTLFAGPLILGAVAIFTPGGLGVTEGTMTAMLVAEGFRRSLAVSATFVTRFCTLWFAMGVGLLALALHRRCRRRASAS
jgi:glycosyltransferase 2 family protein